MLPLILMLLTQTPQPLRTVEAKDLPAARGPMTPHWPDPAGCRDGIMTKIRHSARSGPSLPALTLPADSVHVKDAIPDVSGWRAYRLQVPPGSSVSLKISEGRRAWFRIQAVNRWGRLEEGMLQNLIWKGEPMASYKNPSRTEQKEIWFIVDTADTDMSGESFVADVIWNQP